MRSARSLTIVGIASTFCIVLLWLVGKSFPHVEEFHPKHPGKFDRAEWVWLGEPDHPVDARQTMLDDLQANYLRKGMTALEVAQLLGPADSFTESDMVWEYTLSLDSHPDFQMVATALCLRFDGEGALQSVSVERTVD